MENKKSYYAIIPANVRYDKTLIPHAKLLYGEITALCNDKGYCWASNDYFAELYDTSKSTIQRWMKSLEDGNYIKRDVVYKMNTREVEKRYIRICGEGDPKNRVTPDPKNAQENNTSFNNTNNMSSSIPYSEIIEYLNSKTGKKYKVTQKWKDLIKARFNEGQQLDDFKRVIDVKSKQWLNNPEMSKYLRPQTLFGNKFDEYLNESLSNSQKPKQTTNTKSFDDINWNEIYG